MSKIKLSSEEPKANKNHNTLRGLIRFKPVFLGLIFALFFLLLSLLPSLLPRPWWLQSAISGLSMAIGYGFGLAISGLLWWFSEYEFSIKVKSRIWKLSKIAVPIFVLTSLILGRMWQNEVRSLVGSKPIDAGYLIIVAVVTFILFMFFVFIARGMRNLTRRIRKIFDGRVPQRVGVGLALLSSAFVIYFAVSGILVNSFYNAVNAFYSTRDDTAPEGIEQPQSEFKSGSPASLIPWDKIGFQGRGFVGGGPTRDKISEYTQEQSMEPIRVYAGLASAETASERANLAVAELRRTKAFERAVLVIATATGTGWLDPKAVDSLEYMYGGDTAIVSQQYSYLPSWISFLVDKERAREAGRTLYDAVLEELIKIPENERPKLVSYGLSLGSFGGQEAFSGVNDMRRSVDGVLFTGTPNEASVWRTITDSRDEGSPEWQPIYNGGQSVRFASTKQDMLSSQEEWTDDTRILFLQHANDPVVWFNFDLIFNKPDWLDEPRGRAVSTATRWYPIVTFLQIGLDQAIAESAPVGNGHFYIDTTAFAWQAVIAPEGWTTQDSEKLQEYINSN